MFQTLSALVPKSAVQVILSFVVILGSYGLYKLFILILSEIRSPLHDLPGPPSKSFIYGNLKEIWETVDSTEVHEKWVAEHGSTIAYKGVVGLTRLYTTDLKALNHVLTNSYDYQKPESVIYNIKRILGEGVILVEGDAHKQQRKILNPAFGPQQIRELTEVFVEKSIQLRDIWMAEIQKQGKEGGAKLDALSWLSRMTLDVIGLAGFNYDFHALSEDPEMNELNKAFAVMFQAGKKLSLIAILRGLFPIFRFLPADLDAEARQAKSTMFRIGSQLMEDSKKNMDEKARRRRDILSILMRANIMHDIPESQRMSDKDVLAQIPTFLVAGHETTSVATTWALYALTQNKDIQSRLREELTSISTDNPTMEDLNALPYLENVVRECLRLYAPVPTIIRSPVKDDFLPLSQPFKDKKGNLKYEVRVLKGQFLTIPIAAVNRAKSLWGEDALEFKPDRWDNLPDAVSAVPGVWGNMLTFIGGPRACIGYRFSLVEMKALLFTLIRAFEFDLAVPVEDIKRKTGVVQRPVLITDPDNGNQMPLIVRPVAAE